MESRNSVHFSLWHFCYFFSFLFFLQKNNSMGQKPKTTLKHIFKCVTWYIIYIMFSAFVISLRSNFGSHNLWAIYVCSTVFQFTEANYNFSLINAYQKMPRSFFGFLGPCLSCVEVFWPSVRLDSGGKIGVQLHQ